MTTPLRQRMLEELQGRKSLRLCLAWLRVRWFNPIAEVSELPDHLPRAQLLRSFGNGWAAFLVTNSLVQDQPDQSTLSVPFCSTNSVHTGGACGKNPAPGCFPVIAGTPVLRPSIPRPPPTPAIIPPSCIPPALPGLRSGSIPTCSVTASPSICLKPAPTCIPSRSCWAITI